MATVPRSGWTKANEKRARKAGHATYGAWLEEIEAAKGHEICGGWKPKLSRPCKLRKPADSPSGRCRLCGKKASKGADHYNFGKGRVAAGARSRYNLSGKNAARYDDELQNPELLRVEHEIAVLRVAVRSATEKAFESEDDPGKLVGQIFSNFDRLRKLIESAGRIAEKAGTVTAEELEISRRHVVDVFRLALERHITNPDERTAVLEDMSRQMRATAASVRRHVDPIQRSA